MSCLEIAYTQKLKILMTTLMICWAQTTFFSFVDEAIPG